MDDLVFHDARDLGVRGRPFDDTARFYSRLPERARLTVPEPVWNLSQMSAGLYVDFFTDSTILAAELELEDDAERVVPTRDCSVDSYVYDGRRWGWIGNLFPLTRPVTRGNVRVGLPGGRLLHRMHLPHAGRVKRLLIGIAAGTRLEPAGAEARKPVCCYGTSIVHGFAASRSGMTMPAQLARRLGRPVWNLGFAGNARMEMALAELLAELDPAAFTVDCLPNATADQVTERTVPFVRRLREARPKTPILLVENIVYQATYMLQDRRGGWGPKNDALAREYAKLLSAGVPGVHYLGGGQLLGTDGEATVDGTHPTDLGMLRLADAYESALRPLLD